jgi:hypothetical protein
VVVRQLERLRFAAEMRVQQLQRAVQQVVLRRLAAQEHLSEAVLHFVADCFALPDRCRKVVSLLAYLPADFPHSACSYCSLLPRQWSTATLQTEAA